MKTQFVADKATATEQDLEFGVVASNIEEARELCSWACEVIEVDGGWRAFESATDLEIFENQI